MEMNKKYVGKVTDEECLEIQTIFEHRNGLNDLSKILTSENVELYERLRNDLIETEAKYSSWWERMADKYHWESAENGNWEINFNTCEMFLVTA